MGKCDNCRLRKESAKAFDIHWLGEDDCPYDKCPVPDFPKTNADRIRAMSVEEMAELLTDVGVRTLRLHRLPVAEPVIEQAKEDWLDWLKQEAAE